MSNEVTITEQNFEQEVSQSAVPVLLDFWAEWCMPCKMIGPALHELADSYSGKIKIGKLNVDEQPDIAARFNIVSIPTLLLFQNGEIVKQHVGAAPKPTLEKIFKEYV
ncbi:MAG TPA: thioredoxin [Spirochaetia bacterium]|nr:thioredoxin [Spirochaetia bacterium]